MQTPQSVVAAPCNSFKTAGMRFATACSPLSSVPDCLYCSVEFGTRSVSLCAFCVVCLCVRSLAARELFPSLCFQRPGNAKLTEGKSSPASRFEEDWFQRLAAV